MVARRSLLIRLDLDDAQRLDIIAARRNTDPVDLVVHLILTWLDGPGRHELVAALLHPERERAARRTTTKKPPGTGQLSLVD